MRAHGEFDAPSRAISTRCEVGVKAKGEGNGQVFLGNHDERRSKTIGIELVGQLEAVRERKTRHQIRVGPKLDRGCDRGKVLGAGRSRHLPAGTRDQQSMDR